jgi:hypothetical protein
MFFVFWDEFTTLKGKNIKMYIIEEMKLLVFWFQQILNSNIKY